MVFSTGCEPDVDWSLCAEETGFPRVLPAFYSVSAILYGLTAVLYAISTVRTLRLQLKEKKKTNYNTAVQMHVGIVTFSVAAFIHSVCLVSPQPGMPALPLLLLLHLRHICVGYVTTVLVRHWAVLYQRMGKNQHTQGPLTERVSRFVGLYRDGEVIQAVATCSFFFGSVFYAVRNEDSWVRVERLQFLVWAILSGMTCWLVSILGQRVHAHMKSVARSRAVLDYLKRVKYVVIGSSFLWCQCTVCFSIGAAFDRPLSARAWLVVHGGIVLTSVGAGSLYYVVIGSKTADKAAHAVEAAGSPVEGVKQVQLKFKALAKLVSSGANQLIEGVSNIASIGEMSGGARVHTQHSSDEPRSYRRIASGGPWSLSRRRADTGASAWGGEPGTSSETKLPIPDVDEEVGLFPHDTDDQLHAEEKLQEEEPWESRVSTITPKTSSSGRCSATDRALEDDATHSSNKEDDPAHSGDEDDTAQSGEEGSRDRRQPRSPAPRSKQSSRSCSHNPSTSDDDHPTSSGEPPSRGEEETWRVDELEDVSVHGSSQHGSGHGSHRGSMSSRHHSSNSPSDHGSHDGRGHSDDDSRSYHSQTRDSGGHSWSSRS